MERMLIWFGVGLVMLGLLTIGLGALLWAVGVKQGRLLPGDVVVSRPGFTFVFPVVTCLLLSAVLTLIVWGLTAWRR
jgi:hypothetical protein